MTGIFFANVETRATALSFGCIPMESLYRVLEKRNEDYADSQITALAERSKK